MQRPPLLYPHVLSEVVILKHGRSCPVTQLGQPVTVQRMHVSYLMKKVQIVILFTYTNPLPQPGYLIIAIHAR